MRAVIWAFGKGLTPVIRRFHDALDHPQGAQQAVQKELCDRLIASEYGKTHRIRHLEDWERLPIVDYEDVQPWISRQLAHPSDAILTPEPILFSEKTSGSRGAAKHIPYTRSLRQSFSHLFCIWAQDLIQHGPGFSTGKVYVCVSPKLAEAQPSISPSPEIASSLQDDSDYLDQWLQWVLRPFLVTVPHIGRIRSAEEFKDALCLTLLAEERLEIISVWSPSFLMVQLAHIEQHRERFLDVLGDRLPPHRRDALKTALATSPIPWTTVWPHLKLISCWDSAAAADQADSVRSPFPGVYVQGKGLLATEAPMTVPLIQAQQSEAQQKIQQSELQKGNDQGHVPLLDEVFFEFEDMTSGGDGTIRRLHDLEIGTEYGVIISQKGGLYRYRMGDRIRVTHRYRNTPCLAFVGRSQSVSDLVGEKLNSDFVADVLGDVSLANASFKSLVPVMHPYPHYLLLLDWAADSEEAIAHQIETLLCRAHHYHHARLLGQLGPAQVAIAPNMAERITHYHLRHSKSWGDVKYPVLETHPWQTNWLFEMTERA